MIILFNSSTLQRDCHLVEKFFNMSDKSTMNRVNVRLTVEKQETETDSVNIHLQVPAPCLPDIRILFCVFNSCFTVISKRFSCHLNRKFRLSSDPLDHGKRLHKSRRVQSRFHGTRTMPYTPVSCGIGHSSRGTRTAPYAY